MTEDRKQTGASTRQGLRRDPADRPLRVLLAIPAMERGGPETVFAELLRSFDRREVSPALAVSRAGGAHLAEIPDDVSVLQLPDRRYPVSSFARLVRAVRPDVVLPTLRMNFTALAARPLLPSTTAVVVRQAAPVSADLANQQRRRNPRTRAISTTYAALMHTADRIICQSEPMVADIADRYGPAVAARCCIIPNPVDLERVTRLAGENAIGLPSPGRPTLVSMGRLSHEKGFDILLAALPSVLEHAPQTRLWLLGDGEEKQALMAQAARLGVSRSVEFVGFLDNPFPLLAAADLYVCTSRYEGFSNALVESLAAATPVVAPTGPAAGGDVVDSDTGWLYDDLSPRGIAAAIRLALQLSHQIDGGEAIRTSCRTRFSPATISAAYTDVLRAAAADRTR